MNRVLLIAGGVFQILFVAVHIAMFFGLAKANEVPQGVKPLMHIFNAAVLAVVLFFAYISLLRRRDLAETSMGRAVCWFIALFYLQRGVVAAIVQPFNPVDFGVMMAVATIYGLAAYSSKPMYRAALP